MTDLNLHLLCCRQSTQPPLCLIPSPCRMKIQISLAYPKCVRRFSIYCLMPARKKKLMFDKEMNFTSAALLSISVQPVRLSSLRCPKIFMAAPVRLKRNLLFIGHACPCCRDILTAFKVTRPASVFHRPVIFVSDGRSACR